MCWRNAYSRGTPWAKAVWEVQFAASFTARSVAASAAACSGDGSNFTCTTCLPTKATIGQVYDSNVQPRPERVI